MGPLAGMSANVVNQVVFPVSGIGTIWTLVLLGAAAIGSHPGPRRSGPSASLNPSLQCTLSDMTILLVGI